MEKIYKHIYDNPQDEEGKDKPNELLGEFEIISGSVNDAYSFEGIGVNVKDNKIYKIEGREIMNCSGKNPKSGTMCYVEELVLKRHNSKSLEYFYIILHYCKEKNNPKVLPKESCNSNFVQSLMS